MAVRQVKFDIVADADKYVAGLRRATASTNKFNRTTRGVKGNPFAGMAKGALGAAAGVVSLAGAYSLLKGAISQTVDLAKATRTLQRSTGLAAEDASQLAAVLQVRGVQAVAAGRAFTTLARQTRAAADGSKTAAGAFKELGVSQQAIKTGNVNQILVQAADGFKKLGDGQAKAAIAQQLFGRGAKDMIPIMEGGSAALREQLALAPRMSQAQVAAAGKARRAYFEFQLTIIALKIALGNALMPALSRAASSIARLATEFRRGTGAGGRLKDQLNSLGGTLRGVWSVLRSVWKVIGPAIVFFVKYTSVVALLSRAIRALISIFGRLKSGVSSALSAASTAFSAFKSVASSAMNTVSNAIGRVANALQNLIDKIKRAPGKALKGIARAFGAQAKKTPTGLAVGAAEPFGGSVKGQLKDQLALLKAQNLVARARGKKGKARAEGGAYAA